MFLSAGLQKPTRSAVVRRVGTTDRGALRVRRCGLAPLLFAGLMPLAGCAFNPDWANQTALAIGGTPRGYERQNRDEQIVSFATTPPTLVLNATTQVLKENGFVLDEAAPSYLYASFSKETDLVSSASVALYALSIAAAVLSHSRGGPMAETFVTRVTVFVDPTDANDARLRIATNYFIIDSRGTSWPMRTQEASQQAQSHDFPGNVIHGVPDAVRARLAGEH